MGNSQVGKPSLSEALREAQVWWTVKKFTGSLALQLDTPYSISRFGGNAMLNSGIDELWTIVASENLGTKFDSLHAYLGVGNDSTDVDPTQTGLNPSGGGATAYASMDNGFPTYGTLQLATWRATFDSSTANFAWREFTIANGNSSAAKSLNRKVSPQGIKVSGQIWQLTLEITLS